MNKKRSGKFNLVDLIVILFVVAAAAFFAIRYLGVSPLSSGGTMEVYYEVTIETMPKKLWDEISSKLPAQMIDSGGYLNAHVLSASAEPCVVEKYEARDPYNANAVYIVVPEPGEEFVRAVFECKATLDKTSLLSEMGAQEIRIGRSHLVRSVDFEFIGNVTAMDIPKEASLKEIKRKDSADANKAAYMPHALICLFSHNIGAQHLNV